MSRVISWVAKVRWAIALALVGGVAAACSPTEEWAAQDREKCIAAGFDPNDSVFESCLRRMEDLRRAEIDRIMEWRRSNPRSLRYNEPEFQ